MGRKIDRAGPEVPAEIVRQAFAELKAAKGNRRRAGWMESDIVQDELA